MDKIIYTEPNQALEIMGNRRVDQKLQQKLSKFVSDILPSGPYAELDDNSVPAVRAEYLARPTKGDIDYLLTAKEYGFEPWTVSYEADSYTSSNIKKANMARPRFELPKKQTVRLKVLNQSISEFPSIGDLPTKFGMRLSTLWTRLREYVLNQEDASAVNSTSDISDWYLLQAQANGYEGRGQSKAAYYYRPLMGLYAARAVLFCDFDKFPSFSYATPAFECATEQLGVHPVIVQWTPSRSYPSKEDSDRQIEESSVDLSNETGLCFDNLSDWLKEEVLCETN